MGTDELVKVELPDETPTTWPALVECVTTMANDSVQGDNDLEEDESIPCYPCEMLLNGPAQYIEHIQSKRHRKQVQAASLEADHRLAHTAPAAVTAGRRRHTSRASSWPRGGVGPTEATW